MGHSAGGAGAFMVADGTCDTVAGRFIPLCEGYVSHDKLQGVLIYEGGSGESVLPPGVWAGIVSSTFGQGDGYVAAYEDVTADKKALLSYQVKFHCDSCSTRFLCT